MKRFLIAGAALAFLSAPAFAQTYPLPPVTGVAPADLFQDVVGGVATAATRYATAGQIANVPSYQYITPSATAWTVTQTNGVSSIIVNPTAGSYTGTVTTMANPGDGAILEIVNVTNGSGQITVTANTGQAVATQPPSTLAVYIAVRYRYIASLATWYRVL